MRNRAKAEELQKPRNLSSKTVAYVEYPAAYTRRLKKQCLISSYQLISSANGTISTIQLRYHIP